VNITAGDNFLGLDKQKINTNLGPILSSYGLFLIVVNALVWNARHEHTVQPWTDWDINSQQKLQLAICAVHNWVAAWPTACGGILENLLNP
jgi:hypothetical protein